MTSPKSPLSALTDVQLMQVALGLAPPWKVVECRLDLATGQVDVHLDFERGAEFGCPVCGQRLKAYDSQELRWRHMDFFQYKAYLHARTPRVQCGDCGTHRVKVDWARPGSGYTVLFEALVVSLVRASPVAAVARLVREHDTAIWRIVVSVR